MLKGDLTSTPLAPLLLDLAADSATGCLSVSDADGEEALVYLKGGLVYAISVPGTRPQLGAKLVSSGALAPEALSEALDAQRTELQGWRLGELLVHLGYVDQPVVEAFVKEQVHEALWDLMRWTDGRWRFRKNSKTREDVGPPMVVVELLESLRERGYEWETISAVVHGPSAVPMLSARGDSAAETTLDNDAWSMLCKIDGQRTVAELARDCGYTLFEAGHVIVSLVQAGLVDIDEDVDVEGGEMYGASTLASALNGTDEASAEPAADDDAMTRLARLVTEVAGEASTDDPGTGGNSTGGGGDAVAPAQRQPEPDLDHSLTVPLHRTGAESFAASIARVSGALSDVLGPPPEATDDIDPLLETRKVTRPARDSEDADSEWERRRRLRSAAAAELVNAQALADALRPDRNVDDELPSADPPKLIDEALAAKRAQEEAERHAAEEAAREAAERFARAAADEAERAAAQEEARLAAERQAAAEAERLATEQAERRAAEQAQLAAEEAERLAAEEAERLAAEEAERQAAEQAQLAADIEAAEGEAWAEYWQREEAERAAREAAEQLAAEQEAEAERLAAEQAAQLAAEQEAERLAAEQAAQAEAERLAAEQEAEAARAEAERLAAEQAAQLAAEQEAERLAAEAAAAAEAERIAAEATEREEAERKAAEKVERAARRKAEKAAAAEAARREDEAAAAHAMLIELNSSTAPDDAEAAPADAAQPEPVAEPDAEPVPAAVAASAPPDYADTAALLRELSSLGLDDDDHGSIQAPAAAARQAARPVADDKKPRKKIGLFGL